MDRVLTPLPADANAEAQQQHLKLLVEVYKRTHALAEQLQVLHKPYPVDPLRDPPFLTFHCYHEIPLFHARRCCQAVLVLFPKSFPLATPFFHIPLLPATLYTPVTHCQEVLPGSLVPLFLTIPCSFTLTLSGVPWWLTEGASTNRRW